MSEPSTRDRLLDAAEELISERGFAGVSTRQVIERAGAANGAAVGYHFGSKDNLYVAVLDRAHAPLREAFDAALPGLEADPDASLEDVLTAYLEPLVRLRNSEHGERQARLLAIDLVERQRGGTIDGATLAPAMQRFERLVAQRLPGVPPREAAWRWDALQGLPVLYMLGLLDGRRPREQPGATVRRLVRHAAGTLMPDGVIA
ncbi:TetR/AcrR family transcriptional regulator [Svornostia abyssi]|uniref:TetR/AcrR family transcriptional regulator n=1 Tax=Svornostia abyssi TaxID=2898438 RepID=A0ABY5PBC5_9ACTN|nr:TetR/AcrR family transcriptional regulator [Parviterribacteraceae bacterium J379]